MPSVVLASNALDSWACVLAVPELCLFFMVSCVFPSLPIWCPIVGSFSLPSIKDSIPKLCGIEGATAPLMFG